ncbi:MAG: acetylglutamate kinase [Bacteroidetes bacterium]|nr:acetylglutamate kinase [Bacteroidota bacterium]
MKNGKKLWVIKIGGKVLDQEQALKAVLKELTGIQEPLILVHGGGKRATELAEALNVPQRMVDGRRITDSETLNIALMAYAGELNKKVVARLQSNGCNAIGLTGADGNVLKADKRSPEPVEFGWVGDPKKEYLDSSFLELILEKKMIPVFCALTHDGDGHMLNTNADTMASVIASGMAEKYEVNLVYLFEKKGVMKDVEEEDSLIPLVHLNDISSLQEQGIINAGMLPKLKNAAEAVEAGVSLVLIGSASNLQDILNEKPQSATYVVA